VEIQFFWARLLNSLLIASGDLVFFTLVLFILRIRNPRVRQICYLFTLIHTWAALFFVSPFNFLSFQIQSDQYASWLFWGKAVDGYIAYAWIAIVGVLLAYRTYNAIKTHNVLMSLTLLAKQSNEKIDVQAGLIAHQMNMQKPATLLVDSPISTPFVVGWLKPLLVFPAILQKCLKETETHSILAHELAHIKKRDILLNWVMEIARTVLFFNPVHSVLISKYKNEVEKLRDVEACRIVKSYRALATGLCKVQEIFQDPVIVPIGAGYSTFILPRKNLTEHRLRNLVAFSRQSKSWLIISQILLLSIFFVLSTSLTNNPVRISQDKEVAGLDNTDCHSMLKIGMGIQGNFIVDSLLTGISDLINVTFSRSPPK
jgi:beta-lactamase regulating signal transducer with metallopeptidase domain